MTTFTTFNASYSQMLPVAPRFTMQRVAQLRARLPQMPEVSAVRAVAGVAGRFALAAVPFAVLGWLFIAV
ncbi:MAG: hypothetical protein WDN04_13080 [Rhodospirillales bacterium]